MYIVAYNTSEHIAYMAYNDITGHTYTYKTMAIGRCFECYSISGRRGAWTFIVNITHEEACIIDTPIRYCCSCMWIIHLQTIYGACTMKVQCMYNEGTVKVQSMCRVGTEYVLSGFRACFEQVQSMHRAGTDNVPNMYRACTHNGTIVHTIVPLLCIAI